MKFTFLDMAGKVIFLREDAERAEWTQEEMTLNADFPLLPGKMIDRGQRILFRDPSTNSQEIYEVRQAKSIEPDGMQQIIAEHICISELTDEHIDRREFENVPLSSVLGSLLSGTLWSVGEIETNPVSSLDVSRGSVWQAVLQARNNYNVYIEPRVTLSDSGAISRHLDIKKTTGTWRGLRLSIDKNMIDPSVTIDDTNVATALFGYGGTEIATEQGQENHEITLAEIAWSKTSDHPAKPAGQKYLEDPDATRIYGRNGRPRFGYYQNTDIMSASTLIEKVWETLKTCNTPNVSIEGTVEDLYRMGYADQPLRLHDIALVEVSPAGFKKQIQIIRMTVNLLDPSGTLVTIGSYIPNIVYMNKLTNEEVTGSPGGGGRGGGGGNKSKQTERQEFETQIIANNQMIKLRAYQNDLDDLDNEVKLQEAAITVEHNRITQEVTDRRNADTELSGRITVTANAINAEVTERSRADQDLAGRITITAREIRQEVIDTENRLSGRITVTSNAITAEVSRATAAEGNLSSRITVNADNINLKVNKDGVIAAINVSSESIDISASKINLTGYVTASELAATDARIDNLMSGQAVATYLNCGSFRCGSAQFTLGANTVWKSTIKDGDGNTVNVMKWG